MDVNLNTRKIPAGGYSLGEFRLFRRRRVRGHTANAFVNDAVGNAARRILIRYIYIYIDGRVRVVRTYLVFGAHYYSVDDLEAWVRGRCPAIRLTDGRATAELFIGRKTKRRAIIVDV